MLNEHTLDQLRGLRLDGMVRAIEEQAVSTAAAELSFDERLTLLVQREVDWRDDKRVTRLLKAARLKVSAACIEDINWRASRSLDRALVATLAGGDWLRHARLFDELQVAHGDGSFARRLTQLAKLDLLVIDDFAISAIGPAERNDLLELLDDRVGTHSTLITSQLPVKAWHTYLNDPTLADAILDRIVHSSHRIDLKGKSLRDDDPARSDPVGQA
jgi:hypothetical protein